MNYSNTMKTIDSPLLQADPVISEVRHAKIALAAKHNFDVKAMVRSLQERQIQQQCGQSGTGPRPELKSEGSDKPQPEAEGRSR